MNRARSPSARRSHGWWVLLLVLAACPSALYLSGPIVLDDKRSLLLNSSIRELWPLTVPLSPPRESAVAGRPLVNLTFALNYSLGGDDPIGYRLVNLAIHLLAAVTLFGLVRRVLMLDRMHPVLRRAGPELAFASALLWMLHPLHSEIVHYISQRTEALMGLFWLLTMYCSERAAQATDSSRRWTHAAIVACIAGVFCKESMVTAPVAVALFDRTFLYPSMRDALRHRRRLYLGLAASWVPLAIIMWQRPRASVGFDAGIDAWTYLLNQAEVIATYFRLAVWPRSLVLDYGVPQALTLSSVLVPGLILVALGIVAGILLTRRTPAGFLLACVFVTLAPTSSVVPIVTEVGAERRMYLPLAALSVLVVCGTWRLLRRLQVYDQRRIRLRPAPKAIGAVLVSTVAVLYSVGGLVRAEEYRTQPRLAETVVERRPHARARFALGVELLNVGRRDAAIRLFSEAVDFAPAHFALGTELMIDGRYAAAVREFEAYLRESPNDIDALLSLSRALIETGKSSDAVRSLQRLIALAPRHVEARRRAGALFMALGQPRSAIPHYQVVVNEQPGNIDARLRLADARGSSGDVVGAVEVLEDAVHRAPNHPLARRMLAEALGSGHR